MLKCFIAKKSVRMPKDLKHLLQFHRIKSKNHHLQNLKVSFKTNDFKTKENLSIVVKSPKFGNFLGLKTSSRPVSPISQGLNGQ